MIGRGPFGCRLYFFKSPNRVLFETGGTIGRRLLGCQFYSSKLEARLFGFEIFGRGF
jgi:hypothetical protein